IATIHAIEEVDDEMFIVMEYIEGQELRDIVEAQSGSGRMPLPAVLNYATQIASGLQAAHEKDVTHRDIKSANIMVTDKGQVKIMDFGLAKVRGGALVTKAGTTLGTAAYMSPEQARGEEADHRSDIWAFGVVLYEMLTGKFPFGGDYEQAVFYSIMNEEPETVSSLRPDVPEFLGQILAKALAKSPEQRYQEMSALLQDLNNEAEIKPGARKRGSTGFNKENVGNRRSRVIMLSGLATVLIIIVAVVFWNRFSGDKSASKPGIKRIAVLPLENIGPAEQEYFADGLTGEIISRLSGLSGLSVIARSSAMQYKNTTKSLQQIGEELNVDYVLEGTLRWEENEQGSKRIRVNPELIKIADATLVWSQPYEADFSSAFKLQADIARTVAEALNITLVKSERKSLLSELTNNSDAYDIYLRAIEYQHTIDEKRYRIAEEWFRKAIALDNNFAAAYAKLSTVQSDMYWFYFERSEENLAKSKTNAQRALTLAPNLSEAHVAMGDYYYRGKLEYESAMQEYNEAIRLQPNNADALLGVGSVLRRQGKTREALEKLRRAFELDPRNGDFARTVGETHLLLREYDQADQLFDRAILLAPDDVITYYYKALTYLLSHGDTKAARTVIEAALQRK
ncbi:MAG: protein kinase, partial [Candidatus Poribacteria bacterium]